MITSSNRRPLMVGLASLACLLAAGCSSSKAASHSTTPAPPPASTSTAASAPAAAAATTITIKNFGYTVSGTATSGAMVKVTNNDAEAHTVTADTGSAFDVTIAPGKTASFTAPAAGTYKFHCTFHSNMHGSLTVVK